jgi:hypothetical protein
MSSTKISPQLRSQIRAAIERAKASQEGGANDFEQEGGWKRRAEQAKSFARRMGRASQMYPGRVETSQKEKTRTFAAKINGTLVTGTATSKNKKTGATKQVTVSRRYHGKPIAAAKHAYRSALRMHRVTDNASNVKINLIETTQGLRNSRGERYQYHYLANSEQIAPKPVTRVDENNKPTTFTVTRKLNVVKDRSFVKPNPKYVPKTHGPNYRKGNFKAGQPRPKLPRVVHLHRNRKSATLNQLDASGDASLDEDSETLSEF